MKLKFYEETIFYMFYVRVLMFFKYQQLFRFYYFDYRTTWLVKPRTLKYIQSYSKL